MTGIMALPTVNNTSALPWVRSPTDSSTASSPVSSRMSSTTVLSLASPPALGTSTSVPSSFFNTAACGTSVPCRSPIMMRVASESLADVWALNIHVVKANSMLQPDHGRCIVFIFSSRILLDYLVIVLTVLYKAPCIPQSTFYISIYRVDDSARYLYRENPEFEKVAGGNLLLCREGKSIARAATDCIKVYMSGSDDTQPNGKMG